MHAMYMDDSYIKEFEAEVVSVKDDKYVILSDTAFYPSSGGQPHDTGKLVCDGKEYDVVFVGKFSGSISHEVASVGLKAGDKVKGVIDWERRYKLMRSHTASHVLSNVIHEEFGAKITGNQLSEEKIRVDFNMQGYDKEKIIQSIGIVNERLKMDADVSIEYMKREEVLKDPSLVKLANALPPSIEELRIVTIGNKDKPLDRQADGGTHVKNTKEIGQLELIKIDNRGKNNRRIYVKLAE